ncbi:MAG: metal-dependent hydrolase [Armatimonadota bacterium]|nr:metal-dependent hydrolase [Armatimonadota bacterium]
MTWRTHALVGVASLWLLEAVPHAIDPIAATGQAAPGNIGLLASVAALGALLPDLDAAESKIKHLTVGGGIAPFALPALFLHRAFGHRGLLHSALGLALFGLLVALPLSFWWGGTPSLALWVGYASHLAADACTRMGIPFLFPNRRRLFLLPPRLRFVTGSPAEDALLPLLALPVLLLLLLALKNS